MFLIEILDLNQLNKPENPVLKSFFSKVAKRLQHRCFSVNITEFLRTLKNICDDYFCILAGAFWYLDKLLPSFS